MSSIEQERKQPVTVVHLPRIFRCENGSEFKCGVRPNRCPVCGSTKIEEVFEAEIIGFEVKK